MTKSSLFIFFLFAGFIGHGQSVSSIEPPFWWADMNNNSLQLMVEGKDLIDLKVKINKEYVTVDSLHFLENSNYMFIDLRFEEETEGIFKLEFNGSDSKFTVDYELKPREENSADRAGFDNSDVLYLLTPDRFANGDRSNDEIKGMREGLNRSLDYGRHGGDLQGIEDKLDYIGDMGFTAIWLNPILENDMEQWSYHGYATTDYYKVDPRFGSNEQYRRLTKNAKTMGIGMIMDIIVNHCGSFHPWMTDPPMEDWFNYQAEAYQQTNHRKESLFDPYASEMDRNNYTNGWFVKVMPDLNQENKYLSTYLIQNSIWWIEFADLYGIRQDTYSYSFRDFMTDWTCAILEEYPNFNIVGEEWIDDPAVISYWQQDKVNYDGYTSCLPSLMDFPLCFNLHKALNEEEGWNTGIIKLYQCLSRDFHYAAPDQLVIFPDNHDMSRVFTQLNEDFELFKMAMVFILTTRGVPQLYYGTEILMSNKGTDRHGIIRSDFPGGWQGDSTSVFEDIGLSQESKKAQSLIRKLIHWRRDKEAIHTGKLTHYAPENGVYVYFRHNDNQTIMVALNKNDTQKSIGLDRFAENVKGKKFAYDVINDHRFELNSQLDLPPMSATVLEIK